MARTYTKEEIDQMRQEIIGMIVTFILDTPLYLKRIDKTLKDIDGKLADTLKELQRTTPS